MAESMETEEPRAVIGEDAGNEWELSKENVAPVKRGRKIDTLVHALKMQPTDIEREISERESEFQQELSEPCEDPLGIWTRHVTWIQQALPTGGRQWEEVLERCTRTFVHEDRYKTDARYINIWISYADCCRDADDVYSFMNANGIGTDVAALYEAWADSLEAKENMRAADEVYVLGINRNAYPLEHIKGRHAEFQTRLARHIERTMDAAADSADPRAIQPLASRASALPSAENGQPQPQSAVRPPVSVGVGVVGRGAVPMGALGMGVRPITATATANSNNNNNKKSGGFQVFVDTQFSAAPGPAPKGMAPIAAASVPGIGLSATGAKPLSWTALPSRREASKENNAAPSQWNKHTVPSAVAAPKKGPSFAVFIEEDVLKESIAKKKEEEESEDLSHASIRHSPKNEQEDSTAQKHIAQLRSETAKR